MRNDFKLTEKSNVITLRILKSFLIVFIGYLFYRLLQAFPDKLHVLFTRIRVYLRCASIFFKKLQSNWQNHF